MEHGSRARQSAASGAHCSRKPPRTPPAPACGEQAARRREAEAAYSSRRAVSDRQPCVSEYEAGYARKARNPAPNHAREGGRFVAQTGFPQAKESEMNIGIIGAGNIGGTAAPLFIEAGHNVAISNSRGPETLRERLRVVKAFNTIWSEHLKSKGNKTALID